MKLGTTKIIHLLRKSTKSHNVYWLVFLCRLIITGACGRNQFAYTPERGARHVITQLVLTWLAQFSKKKQITIYFADVFATFIKVNSRKLVRKLRAKHKSPKSSNPSMLCGSAHGKTCGRTQIFKKICSYSTCSINQQTQHLICKTYFTKIRPVQCSYKTS